MKNKVLKNNKKRNLIIIISVIGVLLIGLLLYIFVFKNKNVNVPKENQPEEVVTPVKKLKIIDENSTSRPYAVMINNISTARPLQSGLQDAYIIYEMIVEGGLTRYMALFLDQNTERIGSIRSARHYYLDYALENDAIYVHHGKSPQAQADFSKLNIDRIEVNNTTTGWRDKTLNVSSEHTLFSSIAKLNNGTSNLRTTRNKNLLLNYSVDEIDLSTYENAIVANSVLIPYSSSTKPGYEYDSENKVYKRFVNQKANTDYVTKKQYTFKNIITYKVDNYTLQDGENKGRQDLKNIGSGTGYFISCGYAIPIKWSKSSREAQTKYTLEDGTPLMVNDGNTFIQIQPNGMELTIS